MTRSPTPKQIVKFLRSEAAAIRRPSREAGFGMAPLMREGYPDLRLRSAAEIEGLADFVEANGRVPAVWPRAPDQGKQNNG